MTRTASASRACNSTNRQRKGMVKRCDECVASHTRCDRAGAICERCEKRGKACCWPDQEVEDPTGANILDDPFLRTTTAMNPPPARDNPALRLLDAFNASHTSEPSQPSAPSQSFIFSRLAATTTNFSEPVSSPEPEEDDITLDHRGAPERVFNFSQPQTQHASDAPISERSSVKDDENMPVENNDRDRSETSLGYENPRRVPELIYMGSRRTEREVPLLRFLPR